MGKIVEKKRKKKKGRPSLLDLQKRSLKQQQEHLHKLQLRNNNKTHNKKIQNPNPNSNSNSSLRRSTRRNSNPNPSSDEDEDEEEEEERSSGKRREKKLKLVSKLPDDEGAVDEEENSGSDSNPNDADSNARKRKIDSISHGSSLDIDDKEEKHGSGPNQTSTQQGFKLDGPSTPLPDKKLLLFILDRLQKKDTYGVFADPVDPEELPDYHEVIQHPMDFSTVRKKLADGAYANLEQFEKDVFLICSNAMQYNAPDTIYFRQARSIQELAKKDFENLRQDSDDNEPEPEPKVVRRGRPPTKNLKKPVGRPPLERANSDFSQATLATSGGNANRSNNDLRKGPPSQLEKFGSNDSVVRSLYGSRFGEAYIGWSAERFERTDDLTGSATKGMSGKHGKKQMVQEESKRSTYNQTYSLGCRQEPSVLTTFDGERKQLIAVGLHTEYGYARSLARFAAKLGPVAWKVASRKIERCFPNGVKFGPGWVGESEAPAERPKICEDPSPHPPSLPTHGDSSLSPTQDAVESRDDRSASKPQQGEQSSEMNTPSAQSKPEESSKTLSPPADNDVKPASSSPSVIPSNNSGTIRPGHSIINQSSVIQSRVNGLNGTYGLNFASQMGKLIGASRPPVLNVHQSSQQNPTVSRTETPSHRSPSTDNNGGGEAKFLGNSSTIKSNNPSPNAGEPHQKVGSTPPDLNVGFQSPGSPGSGRADSVQPDLALQL